MTIYKEVQIPFSGFYESSHDAIFDDHLQYECEALAQDYGASEADIEALQSVFYALDWQAIHLQYAKDYCAEFFKEIESESGKRIAWRFKALESPRFYNYETDKIFCDIALDDIKAISAECDKAALDTVAVERHTSCSGFHSFYNPNWREWGGVESWDHNQLCTLLIAWLKAFFDDNDAMSGEGCFSAWDLMESWGGNGGVEGCIGKAGNASAYYDVLNAITEKAARHG